MVDIITDAVAGPLWQDVRHAARTLRRSPALSVTVILTLAPGIGATSAIFNVVNALLLRDLPVADPHRLVAVSTGTAPTEPLTYAVWDQIRRHGEAFDGAFAWANSRFALSASGESEPVDGVYASGDFFKTLGVAPLLGRTFTAADDVSGGGHDGVVAVIGYGLWQRRFGGDASVVGRPVVIDGVSSTIIGVMPRAFFGVEVGRTFDVVVPLSLESAIRREGSFMERRRAVWLTVMLRLKESQSIAAATADLRARQPTIRAAALPDTGSVEEFLRDPFTLTSAAEGTSGLRQRYQQPLVVILVVAGLVLLIACANIANLLLARAPARRGEFSLRFALGASRWRLGRQLLMESLVLSVLGALAALLVAAWGSRMLVAQVSSAINSVALELSIGWHVLGFAGAVTIATALAFGIAPVLRLTRVPAIDALKAQGRLESGGGRLSSSVVVVQVALSLVLVVTAGLLVRTFERMATLPLGFDSDPVLVVNVNATRALVHPADRIPFYHRLVDTLATLPGVEHAAASSITPVSGSVSAFPIEVQDGAVSGPHRILADHVTPGWFATYGMPLRAGRDFERSDASTSPLVAIVNESFVQKFFPGRSAVGTTVRALPPPGSDDELPPITIVGVVGDAIYRSLREEPQAVLYQPLSQRTSRIPPAEISLSVRAAAARRSHSCVAPTRP